MGPIRVGAYTFWPLQRPGVISTVHERMFENFEEHLHHVKTVLQRLRAHAVKLKAKKCNFFRKEVCYLGRIVSEEGYRIDPKNVYALESLKETPPKSVGDVRKLLRLLGYYRRYVPDFARLAKPFDLLKDTEKPCVRPLNLLRGFKHTNTH